MKCHHGLIFFLLAAAAASAQGPKPQLAEQVFRNVQVLKGIPVDQFMSTMGIFSAALGMSCEDCHATNDSTWKNYALDTSGKKLVARRMILMMSRINKENFGGRQVVTCFSCHRGANRPKITPNFATLYTTPIDPDDIVDPAPGALSADQIFDKYIQALGGAQRLTSLTSFIAHGTSAGYGPESAKRPVEIYAKAPNQRSTVTHTMNGESTTTYNGKAGWIAAPLRPVPVLALAGSSLEGVRVDAELSFPARIRQVLTKWRVGFASTIDDRDMNVVQGTGADGAIATFYFDTESGLLVRMVRYSNSPVGRIPTQIDYADYREVAGIRMPHRWTVTWLDGKETFELTDVQPNVPIAAEKFTKPASK